MKAGIRALHRFNERADRLDRSALATRMENAHYQLDYRRTMRGEWISVDGVCEDGIDSFVLNVRLLVQDGDGFSIRCLAKDAYSQNSVPGELEESGIVIGRTRRSTPTLRFGFPPGWTFGLWRPEQEKRRSAFFAEATQAKGSRGREGETVGRRGGRVG